MTEPRGRDKRLFKRVKVESFTLPFLATRESDHQVFQYILVDSSQQGAGIAIPRWTLARERLNKDERVNLHVPFRLHEKNRDSGKVAWLAWQKEEETQYLGIHLDRETPAYYPLHLDLVAGEVTLNLQDFQSSDQLLLQVVKDSWLLKKGVLIYLHHLTPYFSRVSQISSEGFQELRTILLDDVHQKVENNYNELGKLYQNLSNSESRSEDLALSLDLEKLRRAVQSEIYLDLFEAALESDLALQQLRAIKTLEGRLYYNYNAIVMLYMKSFLPA
ncbi:PilZ domain-containing protein [Dethiosulfatarculus sandiegensis]|uniref:PilZ domain-containing protein n=1 Tax=Dethiosulfatarculus sandiegensis TaxID=1429043 RepID=A0A0D2JMZ2_9BACT|nr:PilZ domain-containing protein [Dethiosulfatarculus sandiegensis]KIX10860.1 hypothetical protein X474_26765 [Dethiosulfatarculus sandiegensis]